MEMLFNRDFHATHTRTHTTHVGGITPNFSYKSNNVKNPQPIPQTSYPQPAREQYYQGAPQNPPPDFSRPSHQGY